jgi:hypothetical protein
MITLLPSSDTRAETTAVFVPARAPRRWWAPLPGLGRAPEILAVSCAGVLVVALAYARARAGSASSAPGPSVGANQTGLLGATALYWAGQVVVFAPVAARMLSRRLAGVPEAFTLAVGLAVNQYLTKWTYSPDQFRFPDELQHWTSTTILVETGGLFHPNHALPASVHFPGLEEMAGAIVALTGLSVTQAGFVVAGVAHLVLVGALFMLARRTGASAGVAGLACVVYATGMHYLFFDSMYIYQTAALPFLLLAIWASRAWRPRDPRTLPFGVLGLAAIAVVTVTHHVTALVTVGTLALIAACDLLFGRRPRRWAAAVLALVAAAAVAAWIGFVAREVVDYLGAPVRNLVAAAGKLAVGGSGAAAAGGAADGPGMVPLAIEAIGLLLLLAVFLRGAYVVLRNRRRNPWRWALLSGAVLFFAASGLRFVGAQGPELAGRAATFTYLPMSILAAATLMRWRSPVRWRPVRVLADRVAVGSLALVLLMIGARLGGWPPVWATLPGRYLVSGYERSIDPAGVSAARWMAARVPHGQRVAADSTGWTLASTYGRQDPVGEASALFYAPTWDAETDQVRWDLAVSYVWVDLRMSEQVPKSGGYFPQDPQAGTHTAPMPRALLDKFDGVPGISRIYDNGAIRLYRLGGR